MLAGLVVVIAVCWLNHDQCCDRIAKSKPIRMRVRRSKVNLGNCICDGHYFKVHNRSLHCHR